MGKAVQVFLIVGSLLCGRPGAGPSPAGEQAPASHPVPPTIEPTLPVQIDLRLGTVERATHGGRARLDVEIRAATEVRDLDLALELPDEVGSEDGSTLPERTPSLAAGERRHYALPLRAHREGSYPVLVVASFHLADGRSFRLAQGDTLAVGSSRAPAGRSHLGAYEVIGVTLNEPSR